MVVKCQLSAMRFLNNLLCSYSQVFTVELPHINRSGTLNNRQRRILVSLFNPCGLGLTENAAYEWTRNNIRPSSVTAALDYRLVKGETCIHQIIQTQLLTVTVISASRMNVLQVRKAHSCGNYTFTVTDYEVYRLQTWQQADERRSVQTTFHHS